MNGVLPLEETDPELAEHIRLIVAGEHPVHGFTVSGLTRTYLVEGGLMLRKVIRRTPEPGRNDACYCGSGVKYKKCCGR